MKRLIIAAALLGMVACVGIASAQAQVCLPVAMGSSPNTTGSGTGPIADLIVNGVHYQENGGQSGHVTIPPGATVTFREINVGGYLNFVGFHVGGTCVNDPWNANIILQAELIDLTTGQRVGGCCMQQVEYLNNQSSAPVWFWYQYPASATPGTIHLTSGHVYEWEMNASSYVYGLGRTPVYTASVIITQQ